jgi:hypothetical protein
MVLTISHGGHAERTHRTIKEEEIDLSEHEDYTVPSVNWLWSVLKAARQGSSQVVSVLAKFASQRHTRRLEEASS